MNKIKFDKDEFWPVFVEHDRYFDGYAELTDLELAFYRTAMINFKAAQDLVKSKFVEE